MSDRTRAISISEPLGRRALLAAAVALPLAGTTRTTYRDDIHQPGIVTPPLPFLALGGFDLNTVDPQEITGLLRRWSADIDRLGGVERTLTVGFGPSMFDRSPGLRPHRPEPLEPLPAFAGEAIDPTASHGDLCVQVCASTPTAAADGLRTLINSGRSRARLRWRQIGYRDQDGTTDPRNPFGFRDGTANPTVSERLWVSAGPAWLHGGTYLVVRRIRLLLDTWDRTVLRDQESVIGRTRDENQRTKSSFGHAQLASPARNGGATMLRRSYSYDGGVDANGLQDSGVIFMAFQQDPGRQFVPVQRNLAHQDRLNAFSQHVATGVFACPPAAARGSHLGSALLP